MSDRGAVWIDTTGVKEKFTFINGSCDNPINTYGEAKAWMEEYGEVVVKRDKLKGLSFDYIIIDELARVDGNFNFTGERVMSDLESKLVEAENAVAAIRVEIEKQRVEDARPKVLSPLNGWIMHGDGANYRSENISNIYVDQGNSFHTQKEAATQKNINIATAFVKQKIYEANGCIKRGFIKDGDNHWVEYDHHDKEFNTDCSQIYQALPPWMYIGNVGAAEKLTRDKEFTEALSFIHNNH